MDGRDSAPRCPCLSRDCPPPNEAFGKRKIVLICSHRSRSRLLIDDKTFEAHAQTIFGQAENGLHVQKAILAELVKLE